MGYILLEADNDASIDTETRQGTDRSHSLCSAVVGAPAAAAYS